MRPRRPAPATNTCIPVLTTSTRARTDEVVPVTSVAPATDRWQRQLHTWQQIATKYGLDDSRYDDFFFLCFLDIGDSYVDNYVKFLLGIEDPIIKGRLRNHADFWVSLGAPDWLLEIIRFGVKIPFLSKPPPIFLLNNKSAISAENTPWVRATINEFLRYGFVKKVDYMPYCVMPLRKWGVIP